MNKRIFQKMRHKILFTISVLLSFLLIYISVRVVLSINAIKVNQVFYGENLDKFLILGYTQLSCVVAVLFDIWTVFLTCMNKNILLNVNNRKSGMFYVENIFLVLNFISSIVIYLLISQVNLSKVPWLIWTFVSMFNIMSVGFFLYNLIVYIVLSKRKNISN
jgi:hypothetical protein